MLSQSYESFTLIQFSQFVQLEQYKHILQFSHFSQ